MANMKLSEIYAEIGLQNTAERLRQCGTKLIYQVDIPGKKILKQANFCRVRLCPICQWRKSLKTYIQLTKIINAIEQERPRAYLFLTLTVRNCYPAELGETLNNMSKGIHKFTQYKEFKKAVKGWYRGQEITHNLIENSYHPHYHMLLVVNKNYFGKNYIPSRRWRELWKKSMKLDYEPNIDIRRVKGKNEKILAECCKYMAKPSDYIIPQDWDLSVNTVKLLTKELANRRFSSMGGIVKYWHKKLNLEDVEKENINLNDVSDNYLDLNNPSKYEVYCWRTGYNQYTHGDILE